MDLDGLALEHLHVVNSKQLVTFALQAGFLDSTNPHH